ncbi:MAG: hypothetical protein CYPHOPRED_004048 [Cyphobasidiales sp. Tagirdzhanova-0007]|nr:MAG: hypothetical protein CYPHOPRED_004048 [Cyphobasidiales sp. Tagirdzhanova-0007]
MAPLPGLLRLLFRNGNAAPSKYDSLADLFKNLVADVLDEDAISHVDEDAALGARLRSYFRTIVILLEEATADSLPALATKFLIQQEQMQAKMLVHLHEISEDPVDLRNLEARLQLCNAAQLLSQWLNLRSFSSYTAISAMEL